MSPDNRHTLALPYWARPGLMLGAAAASGSSKVDDDEGDDDEDDEDDDEDDEDDLADLSEEELRAEIKKTRESLSKASGSSKAKRDKIKKLNQELADARKPKATKKKADGEDDDAPDLDAVRDEARREARAEADTRTKKSVTRSELKLAGVPTERVAKAVGLISLDDLDVNDDGEVEGLDEAIDDLRKEWPELFPKGRKKRTSVAGEADSSGERKRRELTASEKQAKVALRR